MSKDFRLALKWLLVLSVLVFWSLLVRNGPFSLWGTLSILLKLFGFFSPIWIIPLAIFHIFYKRKSSQWHLLFSELFILVHAVLAFVIYMANCSEMSCTGGVILVVSSFGALLVNPIIQLVIFYFKKKYSKQSVEIVERMLPREINTDGKNNL